MTEYYVYVNAPGPQLVDDAVREAARRVPFGSVFTVDPYFEATPDVPKHGVMAQWAVGEDGELEEVVWTNSLYRPSPSSRGWPPPLDELDRVAQLRACRYVTADDVATVLLRIEVVYAADASGAPRCVDGCVTVYGVGATLPDAPPAGCSWERQPGRVLAARAPADAELLLNPGPFRARLSARDLAVRAGGEVSGGELVRAIERFHAGELGGSELHQAFCATQLYCEAGETPGFVGRGDGSARVVAVFTSLEQLARFAGQTAWFATIGQEILDLLPDGYDIVVDPAADWTVRLDAGALERRSA